MSDGLARLENLGLVIPGTLKSLLVVRTCRETLKSLVRSETFKKTASSFSFHTWPSNLVEHDSTSQKVACKKEIENQRDYE
jgi:hypothetical protein